MSDLIKDVAAEISKHCGLGWAYVPEEEAARLQLGNRGHLYLMTTPPIRNGLNNSIHPAELICVDTHPRESGSNAYHVPLDGQTNYAEIVRLLCQFVGKQLEQHPAK